MELELTLVRSGVVSAEDYVAALTRQRQERPRLGQVAIEENLLSVRRVLELLHAQDAAPERHFGELAIEHGYLDSQQVAALLWIQSTRERPLVDHLVEMERLTAEAAEAAREAYCTGLRTENLAVLAPGASEPRPTGRRPADRLEAAATQLA